MPTIIIAGMISKNFLHRSSARICVITQKTSTPATKGTIDFRVKSIFGTVNINGNKIVAKTTSNFTIVFFIDSSSLLHKIVIAQGFPWMLHIIIIPYFT